VSILPGEGALDLGHLDGDGHGVGVAEERGRHGHAGCHALAELLVHEMVLFILILGNTFF